jgi:hypothetical protein
MLIGQQFFVHMGVAQELPAELVQLMNIGIDVQT